MSTTIMLFKGQIPSTPEPTPVIPTVLDGSTAQTCVAGRRPAQRWCHSHALLLCQPHAMPGTGTCTHPAPKENFLPFVLPRVEVMYGILRVWQNETSTSLRSKCWTPAELWQQKHLSTCAATTQFPKLGFCQYWEFAGPRMRCDGAPSIRPPISRCHPWPSPCGEAQHIAPQLTRNRTGLIPHVPAPAAPRDVATRSRERQRDPAGAPSSARGQRGHGGGADPYGPPSRNLQTRR